MIQEHTSSTRFTLAVVVGKFLPPHRGHEHLIQAALDRSDSVTVIVCDRHDDPIPGTLRGAWIRELFPAATVMVIDDQYDPDDSLLWGRLTIGWLGRAPDAVFTSEDYGAVYAAAMGSTHVSVDKARAAVPCSGTVVRADPFAMWDFISPPVRGWYARRVCVLGAESTGTTTLAASLADALQTTWVPEYGREYSALKQQRGEAEWHTDEFTIIAREQNLREEMGARDANRIVICDTDSFATNLWHRRYVGGTSPEVARLAASRTCDLYLLTGDEIPFVQDGLRDGEHLRHEMHRWFIEALEAQPVPWTLLSGNQQERLAGALRAIAPLFADSSWLPALP